MPVNKAEQLTISFNVQHSRTYKNLIIMSCHLCSTDYSYTTAEQAMQATLEHHQGVHRF